MSTVGLTKAMRRSLERDGYSAAALVRAMDAGFINPEPGAAWLTPRGHAALAAPRMTQAEYDAMCEVERGWTPATARMRNALHSRGWIVGLGIHARTLTPVGRTALNNVRAAMPGEWRQVGSPDWKESP